MDWGKNSSKALEFRRKYQSDRSDKSNRADVSDLADVFC